MAIATQSTSSATTIHQKITQTAAPTSVAQTGRFPSTSSVKLRGTTPVVSSRVTAPRLVAQAEKNAAALAQNNAVRMPMSHPTSTSNRTTPAAKVATSTVNQTFAAKLTETTSSQLIVNTSYTFTSKNKNLGPPQSTVGPVSPQSVPHPTAAAQSSPNRNNRPAPTASAPPNMQHFQSPGKVQQPMFGSSSHINPPTTSMASVSESNSNTITLRSSTPNLMQNTSMQSNQEEPLNIQTPSEYSLFYTGDHWSRREQESQKPINFAAVTGGSTSQSAVQHKFIDQEPPPQVDASKAPGYRGAAVCSPVSSKTSSNSTTPPNISANSSFQSYQEPLKSQNALPPIGSNMVHRPPVSQTQTNPDINLEELIKTSNMLSLGNDVHMRPSNFNHIQNLNFSQPQPPVNIQQSASMSRLNPKAPEYSSYNMQQNKSAPHLYNGYQMNNLNNMYTGKQNMDSFQPPRSNMGTSQQQNRLWMQMPTFTAQQSDQFISGFAGMTLHNIAKITGNEVLDASGELGIVNNSPNMSPNLPPAHHLHPDMYMEDRKPPQPIGTGRKIYNNPLENWRMNEKPEKWSMCGNAAADYTLRNPSVYTEDFTDYSVS